MKRGRIHAGYGPIMYFIPDTNQKSALPESLGASHIHPTFSALRASAVKQLSALGILSDE